MIIVSDVGGTNIRFGWAEAIDSALQDVVHLRCGDFENIDDAFLGYKNQIGLADTVDAVSIAVAGPVNNDRVDVTNNHWVFSKSELRQRLNTGRLLVMNDFTAQALAQSDPSAHGNQLLMPGYGQPDAPLLIIGPGTGLGVSALFRTTEGLLPLEGEGGHVSFAPRSDQEIAVMDFLKQQYDYVSAEHIVSGFGLENLYRFITQGDKASNRLSAPEIGALALEKPGACRDAVVMMLNALGGVIANNVLTLGTWAGVVVTGGIVPKLASLIDSSELVLRIRDIGIAKPLTADLPVWLSLDQDAGLRGAKEGLASKLLESRDV